MHARGSLQWMDHPEFGRVVLPHSPIRFDGTPLLALTPSGRLGAQNADVYQDWLGIPAEEYDQLTKDDII